MATVSSPPFSTPSNKRENSLDSASNPSTHTVSPRKLKRFQSVYIDELHGESKCKYCEWRYPTPNPDSRQRRHHKKICPKLSSLGSEGEIGRSGDSGSPAHRESGGSSVLTVDHEVTDTAKSRGRLSFSEMEQEVTEREVLQKESERPADDHQNQGSSTLPSDAAGHHGTETREEEVVAPNKKELGSQQDPQEDPQSPHPPPSIESDVESGSNGGATSISSEYGTGPDDDMPLESLDIEEDAKREDSQSSDYDTPLESFDRGEGDSLPSDHDMLQEENKHGLHFSKREITPTEGILEERLSNGHAIENDLESLLKKQKTHDLFCPMCRSQITKRIVFRKKKRRSFSSRNEAKLPNLNESTSEDSGQENNVRATVVSRRNWLERCLHFIGFFRRRR